MFFFWYTLRLQVVGLLSTVYGAIQLVSGPAVGAISDTVSRRWSLIVITVGGFLGYELLVVTSSLLGMVVSRVIVGFCRQYSTVTKALVCELSTDEDRTVAVGEWLVRTVALAYLARCCEGHLANLESILPLHVYRVACLSRYQVPTCLAHSTDNVLAYLAHTHNTNGVIRYLSGYIYAVFSLGFAFGPALGGMVAQRYGIRWAVQVRRTF